MALNHRFLDYRVTRGKTEKDFVETREEDERVQADASEMRGRDGYGGWNGRKREGQRVDLAESVADESTL